MDDSRKAPTEARRLALSLLAEADPFARAAATRTAAARVAGGEIVPEPDAELVEPAGFPARSARPPLVHPRELKPRPLHTPAGRIALLHAVTHIECNAIALALDSCWRFAGMPVDYYLDWWRVAGEEADHFQRMAVRLDALRARYGDLPAHDGLWRMAEATKDDVLARMALVPRLLEARGLDVTPAMREKLAGVGDHDSAAVLDIILRDEIGHVAIGNRWFHALCEARGVDPLEAFDRLAAERGAPSPKPPFNVEARAAAGFTAEELARLQGASAPSQPV